MARVTFDDLLRKKLANDAKKAETTEIEVFDGKTMVFHRLAEGRLFEIIEEFEKAQTTASAHELITKLIYECCDELRSEELLRKMEIIDPLDIVPALFSPNERVRIGDKLTKFLEIDEEEIKNA